MNFHTFELSYRLSLSELSRIKDVLYDNNGRFYLDKGCSKPVMISECLKKYGIIIKLYENIDDSYKYALLSYRVNPRRIFDVSDYVGIFDPSDTSILVERFNELVTDISPLLPQFDSCNLNRLDFCSNAELSGQTEICTYMKLLQRGYIPPKYEAEVHYDKKSKRKKMYKHSITIRGTNGVTVTYYNKYHQMKNEKLPDSERANKIIRIEIQCNKKKLLHLSQKFGYDTASDFLRHGSEIGRYVFNQYANVFYGSGNFYKLGVIYDKIDNSSLKNKSKKVMKEVAGLSAKYSSLQKAFDKLKLNQKEIKSIIKKFDKINVSPIPIPRRYKYDYLPNPLSLSMRWSKYDDIYN